MPDLLILIPFNNAQGSDLDEGAAELVRVFGTFQAENRDGKIRRTDPGNKNAAPALRDVVQENRDRDISVKFGENIGAKIERIHLVYLGNNLVLDRGDYMIVFAHGGEDDTDLSNNMGSKSTMNAVIEKLKAMEADNAEKILFMTCFSALEGHIAPEWKRQNPKQSVFGTDRASSNLWSRGKSGIRAICMALSAIE